MTGFELTDVFFMIARFYLVQYFQVFLGLYIFAQEKVDPVGPDDVDGCRLYLDLFW